MLDALANGVRGRMQAFLRNDKQTLLQRPKCEVKPSAKHGSGIFATRAIKPGELVTLYPADGIVLYLHPYPRTECMFPVNFDGLLDLEAYSVAAPKFAGHRVKIVGDPSRVSDCGWVGHMANDVCRMTHPRQANVYEAASIAGRNAVIGAVPFAGQVRCCGLWATRDIGIGEEILVHYGVEYWMHNMPAAENQGIDLETMD